MTYMESVITKKEISAIDHGNFAPCLEKPVYPVWRAIRHHPHVNTEWNYTLI